LRADARPEFRLSLVPTTRAARDVLGLLGGEATKVADAEARDQAAQALGQLLGGRQPYTVYLRNGGVSDSAEQVIEVRVATDVDAPANTALVERLNGKALLLVGTEKEDRHSGDNQFVVFSVRAIPGVWGQKDAWSRVGRVMFGDEGPGGESGFPMRLLAAVSRLPEARAQRETINKRLADWHRYLDVLERTARARQFSVSYKAFRRPPGSALVVFTLEAGREPLPWDKLKAALDEPLEVRERRPNIPPAEDDDGDDWVLGYVTDVAPERSEITVALDDDATRLLEGGRGGLALPRAAALVYKASGDLAQVRRLKFGLEQLEQGYGENPRLSEFLFDVAQARQPDPSKRITLGRTDLLQPQLNEEQLAAVEGALNAPDLFLIQGPPGTGKTTVIAEICYQNALRGQRTLIASQANLAVDNALSKLVHHPRIRALRRGRADRVEVEGQGYLEDQVVGTWLVKTAGDVERDLAKRHANIKLFEELLHNRPRLEKLARAFEQYSVEQPKQQAEIAALEARREPLEQQAEQLARSLERRREARAGLAKLEARLSPEAAANVEVATNGHRPAKLDASSPAKLGATSPTARGTSGTLTEQRWLDHAAVRQLQQDLDELTSALLAWGSRPRLPGQPADDVELELQDRPDEPPGLEQTLRLAQIARHNAGRLVEQLGALRGYLDELAATAAGWQRDFAEREALGKELAGLQQAAAALEARQQAAQALRAELEAKIAELAAYDAARAPVRAALQSWLDRLTTAARREGAAPAWPQMSAPPEFGTPLAQEIWAAAGEAAQLHKLGASALEARAGRVEARRLAELVVQLERTVQALLAQLSPEALKRVPPGRARRASDWRNSPLQQLVACDAHGGLHPAFEAEAAWQRLRASLAELNERPAWWQRLAGRERRRQQTIVLWVQRLRSAAEAFARRRGELEALARHRAQRLQERLDATAAAMEVGVAEAARTFGPQAQQRLAAVRAELDEVGAGLPPVQARSAALEEQVQALVASQAAQTERMRIGLEALGTGRPTRHFQHLLRQVDKLPPEAWQSDWTAACGGYDAAVRQLATLRDAVDPLAAVAAIAAEVEADRERLDHNLAKVRASQRGLDKDLEAARQRLGALEAAQAAEDEWWTRVLEALPVDLRPPAPEAGAHSLAYVRAVLAASDGWMEAVKRERAYLARAEALAGDWVKRLASAEARDREDLRQIYIDNANVIGITCVHAGSFDFSRRYRNFDCVIIDEVSKATPPELLLPMLKGARVVLVGDHKQLPPMIGPETIADLALEMGVPRAELEHLERSLFKELFEAAAPELRVMLTQQYRMHPQIMHAINQFYQEQLACGLPRPDDQRAHGFQNLAWLKPENHLLWMNTPAEGSFVEQRVGTTYLNAGELDVIERLVKQLDTAWAPCVAAGQAPKDVGVITFYAAQTRALRERLLGKAGTYKNLRLRVGTVDRFQGMERPVIIVSLVRNNSQGTVGFARKPERVNVAFSRAQELLVIVGSRELFTERARDGQSTTIYSRVAEAVQAASGLRRVNGAERGDVSHTGGR
jgi:hypothetical protein